MLQRLSDHIQACYQRAAEAEELAARAITELKSHYLDAAQRWTYLAKSYEFTERLERFLLEVDKNGPTPPANWQPIASAPFDRKLRLAVVSVHGAAIPIAAGILYPSFGILLSPIVGAAAMALSSVSVIANALRLRTVRL